MVAKLQNDRQELSDIFNQFKELYPGATTEFIINRYKASSLAFVLSLIILQYTTKIYRYSRTEWKSSSSGSHGN